MTLALQYMGRSSGEETFHRAEPYSKKIEIVDIIYLTLQVLAQNGSYCQCLMHGYTVGNVHVNHIEDERQLV